MADEKSSHEEFRLFIRDIGIRAFDQLASQQDGRRAGSLARLTSYWSEMRPAEKEQFFDQMIDAAQNVASPALIGIPRTRRKPAKKSAGSESETKKKTKKK